LGEGMKRVRAKGMGWEEREVRGKAG